MYEDHHDKKIDVLISALEERYKAKHEIRTRLQNVSIWTLGIFVAASGWLFQSDTYLLKHEQVTLLIILSVLIYILFKTYIKDLEKGFRTQQKAASGIEQELGFYDEGTLSKNPSIPPAGKSLVPKTAMVNILILLAF